MAGNPEEIQMPLAHRQGLSKAVRAMTRPDLREHLVSPAEVAVRRPATAHTMSSSRPRMPQAATAVQTVKVVVNFQGP